MTNLERIIANGLTPYMPEETYGDYQQRMEADINAKDLPNVSTLMVGACGSGKTTAAKLAILRQHRDKRVLVVGSAEDYGPMIESLGGVVTGLRAAVPDEQLVLLDHDGAPGIVALAGMSGPLRHIFWHLSEVAERPCESLVVLDDMRAFIRREVTNPGTPRESTWEEECLDIVRNLRKAPELNATVLVIVERLPHGYPNETWQTLYDKTPVKAYFRQPVENGEHLMINLGFGEAEAAWMMNLPIGAGVFQYHGNLESDNRFVVSPTPEEAAALERFGTSAS